MVTVKDVMRSEVYSIHANSNVRDLLNLFIEKQITGALVVNENNELAGIITDADVLGEIYDPPTLIDVMTFVAAFDTEAFFLEEIHELMDKPVNDLMTKKVITVTENTRISKVAQIFSRRKFKKVPVVNGQKIIGVVSRGDVVRYLVQKFLL